MTDDRYVSKTKDRKVWIKKRDHLKAQQAELEAQMTDFIAKHEAELNALLQEYVAVRNQTGMFPFDREGWELMIDDYMNTLAAKLDLNLDVARA